MPQRQNYPNGTDLWDDTVALVELLQLWDNVCGAAGGGLGSGRP